MIIFENTTWNFGETIVLTENLEIAHGATLTIEDGVTVTGNNNAIIAYGNLLTEDNFGEDVTFSNVRFSFGNVSRQRTHKTRSTAEWTQV